MNQLLLPNVNVKLEYLFQGMFIFSFSSLKAISRKPHPIGIKIWGISDSHNYYYSFSLFEKICEKVVDTVTKLVNQLPSDVKFNIIADSYFGGMATAKGFLFIVLLLIHLFST